MIPNFLISYRNALRKHLGSKDHSISSKKDPRVHAPEIISSRDMGAKRSSFPTDSTEREKDHRESCRIRRICVKAIHGLDTPLQPWAWIFHEVDCNIVIITNRFPSRYVDKISIGSATNRWHSLRNVTISCLTNWRQIPWFR